MYRMEDNLYYDNDSIDGQRDNLNVILKCKQRTVNFMKEILLFLNQYFWIYDGHMTRIFSDSKSPFYSISPDWHQSLRNLTPEEMNKVPFGLVKEDWPESLQNFVQLALKLGRFRFFQDSPKQNGSLPEKPLPASLLKGINPKKLQEVEGMARRIASICIQSGSSSVLDIGAGMGYLDQVLHYRYGLTVLGVDAIFSHGAQSRMNKTSKSDDYCSANVMHVPFTLQPTENSLIELEEIMVKAQPPVPCPCQKDGILPENGGWVVVALHACGNLTNSVLKFYRKCAAVRALVCLSCCYHKMTPGEFPLSRCLQECVDGEGRAKCETGSLSLYGLRLASQETRARWAQTTPEIHTERANHVLYRASIEHALSKKGLQWERPQRRIGKQSYRDFETYCNAALIKYDDSVKNEAMVAYEKFKVHRNTLQQLTLLQVLLQPVLESLVLLDRALYINFDSDEKHTIWLEAVAPELVSPRNIAVLAVKEAC